MNIYICDTNLIEEKKFDEYTRLLDEERVEKISRLKLKDDRRRGIAAGVTLLIGLINEEIECDNVSFSTDDKGKPYVKGLKDKEVHFNISHSGNYAVVCIGNQEVGIDIEKIKTCNFKVAKRCFTERECTYLEGVSKERQDEVFTRIWTLKESFLKATGEGIRNSLNLLETGVDRAENCLFKGENINGYFKVFENIDGYVMSLCTLFEADDVKLQFVDEKMLESFRNM